MPDPQRLDILALLRRQAGVTLAEMARVCGLSGRRAYESASAWERGLSKPNPRMCHRFAGYLVYTLRLHDSLQLQSVWRVLEDEWGWEPLKPDDIDVLFDTGRDAEGGALAVGEPTNVLPRSTLSGSLTAPPAPGPLPPGSRMPYPPNPLFVGRAALLMTLAEHLIEAQTDIAPIRLALIGPGGIGKSQVAAEFAHRFGRAFAGGVFWIACGDTHAALMSIAVCAGPDGLDLLGQLHSTAPAVHAAQVLEAWSQPVPRLLIFDNCEDSGLLAHWAPQRGGARILITSRRVRWPAASKVQALLVSPLTRAESLDLLGRHRPDRPDPDALTAIAAELDDLPLALHLAGSYLARGADTITPAAYLVELRHRLAADHPSLLAHPSLLGQDAHGRNIPSPTGHAAGVAATIALSLRRLDAADPTDALAQILLSCAACLAPGEPIPLGLLTTTLRELHTNDEPASVAVAAAIVRLISLGIVLFFGQRIDRAVQIHRLIAWYLRETTDFAQAQAAVEAAVFATMQRLNGQGDQPALIALQPHLRWVADRALQRDSSLGPDLAYELSRHLGESELYAEAERYNRRSLELRQAREGPDSLATAENHHYAGLLSDWQGDYVGAEPHHARGLALRRAHLGDTHLDTADSLNLLGEVQHANCHYAAAYTSYLSTLQIRERLLGLNHPEVAGSLNNLGLLLNAMGRFTEGHGYLERAIAIWSSTPQPNRSRQAIALNNLGYLLRAMGRYAEALPCLHQALAIREELYSENSTYLGVTLNHLGRVAHYTGDLALAEAHLKRALAILVRLIGEEHPITANTLGNLGMLLLDQGDPAGARPPIERALAIHLRRCSANHRNIARSLNHLGLLEHAVGKRSAAEDCYQQALTIREQILGPEHHDTANSLGHLGLLHLEAGDIAEARRMLTTALRCHSAQPGGDHPYTARSLLRISRLYRSTGDCALANENARQAYQIYQARLGDDHPFTRRTLREADN